MVDSARERLMAALETARARPLTTLATIAGVVIFLLLLGGNAGVAVLVALLVVPAAILFYLTRLDLYEREPWALLASVVGAGALVGLLGGLIATFVFERFWFSDSRLNLGAVGFAGISANGEGSVPVGVVLLGGILIPVLTGAAILGGPIALRRWPVFRNEITDGMTLGGLAAAGFATVSSFVYFWPSAFDDLPDRPVSQWTALLAGIIVIRPVVLILAGSLLGIAAWQYLSTKDIRSVLVAGIAGIFGWLALPLGSLLLAQSGAVTEFVWYAIVLIVVGVLFRQALGRSLAVDRQVLAPADDVQRVVCPNCHRVTPEGSFCSFCRAPLHPEAPTALDSPTTSSSFADPLVRSSTGESVASTDWSSQESVTRTPIMARDTPAEHDPRRVDTATDPTAADTADGLDEVSDEPAIDAFDDQARPSSTTELNQRTGETADPLASGVSSPTDQVFPDTSRFKRPSTDDQDISVSVRKLSPEAGPLDRAETDAEPDEIDRSGEPSRPISLQDWSRRSEPTTVSDAVDARDAPDPDRPFPSAQPGSSPWKRSAGPGSEPVSGLKWPTSSAAPFDQLNDPNRIPIDATGSPGGDESRDLLDHSEPADESEQRPVASSSGRWFDASSTLGGATPAAPTSIPAAEPLADDSTTSPHDPAAMATADDPGRNGLKGLIEDPTVDEPADEQTPPSGLRWYRQDDEGVDPDDSPSDIEPDYSLEADDWQPERAEPAELPAPTADIDTASESGPRPGIWRSFTRPGRGGAPRAPQRDHGQTDEET